MSSTTYPCISLCPCIRHKYEQLPGPQRSYPLHITTRTLQALDAEPLVRPPLRIKLVCRGEGVDLTDPRVIEVVGVERVDGREGRQLQPQQQQQRRSRRRQRREEMEREGKRRGKGKTTISCLESVKGRKRRKSSDKVLANLAQEAMGW